VVRRVRQQARGREADGLRVVAGHRDVGRLVGELTAREPNSTRTTVGAPCGVTRARKVTELDVVAPGSASSVVTSGAAVPPPPSAAVVSWPKTCSSATSIAKSSPWFVSACSST